ncbi:MAG: Spy/CpxP family protein refolding chaperone [Polyangiales bacterium]
MIGFVIGTVCLVMLVATVRRRHAYHAFAHAGFGGPCGPGAMGPRPRGFGGPWAFGGGPRGMLRAVFASLETTPGQEKAIVAEAEKCRDAMREGRKELRESREDIARAVGGDVFDEVALAAAYAKHDAAIGRMREAGTAALAKVHEVLDAEQRKKLAETLGHGYFRRSWGGPYRGGF